MQLLEMPGETLYSSLRRVVPPPRSSNPGPVSVMTKLQSTAISHRLSRSPEKQKQTKKKKKCDAVFILIFFKAMYNANNYILDSFFPIEPQ